MRRIPHRLNHLSTLVSGSGLIRQRQGTNSIRSLPSRLSDGKTSQISSFCTFLDASTHLSKSVRRSVRHVFFSMSRLLEKMFGNDWENSLNAPNSSKSYELSQNVPKYLKMFQNVHFRRIVVRTDLFAFLRYFFVC